MIMNSIPPCKGCEERHTACHDHCERYKQWKAEIQAAHKKEKAYLAQRREDFMRSEARRGPNMAWKVRRRYGGQ